MTPDGFLEGERSLVADRGPMIFRRHASDRAALEAVAGYPSVRRLDWFTHGFLKAERRDRRLVLSDLGWASNPTTYSAMLSPKATGREARRTSPSSKLDWPSQDRFRLAGIWRRIWKEPNPDEPRNLTGKPRFTIRRKGRMEL